MDSKQSCAKLPPSEAKSSSKVSFVSLLESGMYYIKSVRLKSTKGDALDAGMVFFGTIVAGAALAEWPSSADFQAQYGLNAMLLARRANIAGAIVTALVLSIIVGVGILRRLSISTVGSPSAKAEDASESPKEQPIGKSKKKSKKKGCRKEANRQWFAKAEQKAKEKKEVQLKAKEAGLKVLQQAQREAAHEEAFVSNMPASGFGCDEVEGRWTVPKKKSKKSKKRASELNQSESSAESVTESVTENVTESGTDSAAASDPDSEEGKGEVIAGRSVENNEGDYSKAVQMPANASGEAGHVAIEATIVPGKCRLLELPAELRNTIYEYALYSDPHINVGHDFTFNEPGLLHTSRQIRREAREIFYLVNRFRFHVWDLDCTLLRRWVGSSKPRRNASMWIAINRSNNWRNFKRWLLNAFFDSRLAVGMPSEPSTPTNEYVYAASQFFQVMMREKHTGAQWNAIEQHLEDIRRAMQIVRPGYMAG